MYRRRPPGRARILAQNRRRFAALFLLRTPDNKSFEKPIHVHKACTPEIFLPRRLQPAICRQWVCRRKAGMSMGFPPQLRFRGDRQDTQRTVEEKSTPAIDRSQLQRSHRELGSARHPLPRRSIRGHCTRSIQSPAANLKALALPIRRRLLPVALAQSAGSGIGNRGTLAVTEKFRAHLAAGDALKTWASLRELSGSLRKNFFEMLPGASRSAVLPRRMDNKSSVRWRGGCGSPTWHPGLFGSQSADDLEIHRLFFGRGGQSRHLGEDFSRMTCSYHRR